MLWKSFQVPAEVVAAQHREDPSVPVPFKMMTCMRQLEFHLKISFKACKFMGFKNLQNCIKNLAADEREG